MSELQVHAWLAYGVLAVAGVVFASLFFIVAPYGRHARAGWGPTVPQRVGWVLMEGFGAIAFAVVYALGQHAAKPVPLVLCLLWLGHYVHRSFIFPFRMRATNKTMPVSVVGMAIVFNGLNAWLNARWISHLGEYALDARLVAGLAIFLAGMALNIHSDNILLNLRKPGEEGYRIPFGGAFRWVTSPNYLGELVEWAGWAVATASLGGLAFFVFTFANLVPRAVAHHRWYRRTFPDYPKNRRAVIPFLV